MSYRFDPDVLAFYHVDYAVVSYSHRIVAGKISSQLLTHVGVFSNFQKSLFHAFLHFGIKLLKALLKPTGKKKTSQLFSLKVFFKGGVATCLNVLLGLKNLPHQFLVSHDLESFKLF